MKDGEGMADQICNRDCLNCIYPDCILDAEPDAEELCKLRQTEQQFLMTPKQRKQAEWNRVYRKAHPDRIAKGKRAHYERNREKIAAYHREHYRQNRERILAQQKAYRARKKAEKAERERG